MIPNAFEYLAPTTLQEALSLLSTHKDDAKVLAGGHSLLPMMKLRLAAPAYLIDLAHIPHLAYIREREGRMQIGPLTTHYMIESSNLLRQRPTALPEAAGMIGDVQGRKAIDEASIITAAGHSSEGVEALSDLHASGDYRLALARVYTKRALLRALTRAQGGTS